MKKLTVKDLIQTKRKKQLIELCCKNPTDAKIAEKVGVDMIIVASERPYSDYDVVRGKLNINISIILKATHDKIDVLLFSHDNSQRMWLGINEISEHLNLTCRIIYPNQLMNHDKKYKLNSIPMAQIGIYSMHIFRGLIKFSWALRVNFKLYLQLMSAWKYFFLFDNLYKNSKVQVVFSGGYESLFSQVAVALASDRNNMVSFESTATPPQSP